MKIKIRDLLNLNGRVETSFLIGHEDFIDILAMEKTGEQQILPEWANDWFENSNNHSRYGVVPFHSVDITAPIPVNSQGDILKTRDDLDVIIEKFMEDFVNRRPTDKSVYTIKIDFYNNKPIIIRTMDLNLTLISIYYMNIPELTLFRNDLLFKWNDRFSPDHIPDNTNANTTRTLYETIQNEPIKVVFKYKNIVVSTVELTENPHLSVNADPLVIFDSNYDTVGNEEIMDNVFWDDIYNGSPGIQPQVIRSIIGYDYNPDNDNINPLPLTDIPFVSLSLYTDDESTDNVDTDYVTWELNVDGVPTLLYIIEGGCFCEPEWVYIINDEKYNKLESFIRNIYIAKFVDIPAEKIITEDDEIEIEDTDFIRHKVIDNQLQCFINVYKYN